MQLFAVSRTEQGIRKLAAVRRAAQLDREREAHVKGIEQQIADLQKELGKANEPTLIKSEFRRIEERACRIFRVSPLALKSPRRNRRLAHARFFIAYWAIRRTMLSSTQIGRLLGGRDHTTVLHGRDKYRELRAKMGRTLREAR